MTEAAMQQHQALGFLADWPKNNLYFYQVHLDR